MHEVGLCEGVLDAVLRRAAGRRVTGITVRVGVLHRVAEPAFDQAFALVSAGTDAEDATIDLRLVPVRAKCASCGAETESPDLVVVCPSCGSSELDVLAGDELVLESISVSSSN